MQWNNEITITQKIIIKQEIKNLKLETIKLGTFPEYHETLPNLPPENSTLT